MRYPRLVWSGLVFRVKEFMVSRWFLLISVLQPIIFATIAFYMFKAGRQPGTLLYVALGAGMMGIWSSTLFGSGGALQWNRWQGTLELLVASPPPFIVVLLPLTLATSVTGAWALLSTLFWGRVFFGVPLHLVTPLSWLLAPRWGIDAIRHAALGGGPVWFPIAMCAATGAAYLVLAAVFLQIFERAARARATLALT